MLKDIRKNSSNFVFTLLIGAIVIVMAFFGMGQMGGPTSPAGKPIAWVNGEVITQGEFSQELQARVDQYRQILGPQFNESMLGTFRIPEQTLDSLIRYRLIKEKASEWGFHVSDEQLSEHIQNLPYFKENGKFSAERYRQIRNKGLLERRERENLQVRNFQTYLSSRNRYLPSEIKKHYARSQTKYKLKVATVDFAKLSEDFKPTEQDIQGALSLRTDEELKNLYQQRIDLYTTPEEIKLKQIRVGVPFGANKEKEKEALDKINQVKQKTTVDSFSEQAKNSSDDSYAAKGGERGWVKRGSLYPAIEKVLDTLEAGKVSAPIKTEAGYFIVLIDQKKPSATKPFQEVKNDLGKHLALESHKRNFEKNQLEEWNKTLKKGRSLVNQLKKKGVETKTTEMFSLNDGYIPNVGQTQTLLKAVSSLTMDSKVLNKLVYENNKYYYAELVDIQKPDWKEFDKKKSSLRTELEVKDQNLFSQAWIKQLEEKASIKKEINFDNPEGFKL